ncbi:hypothetical protein IWQ62_001539 [Dispira parvispora]|uniref:glutathione-specific gamma-glutamylcyclotransferase n=1 Tax=Dispira parvispora TaxID=1520584 RepID=A0A9W8AUT2_9FUNG|nr:hypothetical protein IWQ62_001539 [Dispira parvispora]
MWVFGYGSLIWKVDFPIEDSRPGYIKGYARRFWQGSHDHRGTETHPGRVVTLIPTEQLAHFETSTPSEEELTWGVAYKVAESQVDIVRKHLDYREKNGYTVHHVHVYHPDHAQPVVEDALVYIGTVDNEAFLGPADSVEIANQIYRSVGPSGPNVDYLLNLCVALRAMGEHALDTHLFELEAMVLRLREQGLSSGTIPLPLTASTSVDVDNQAS